MALEQQLRALHPDLQTTDRERKRERGIGPGLAFEASKPTPGSIPPPSGHTSSNKVPPPNPPQTAHQLRTKHADLRTYAGHSCLSHQLSYSWIVTGLIQWRDFVDSPIYWRIMSTIAMPAIKMSQGSRQTKSQQAETALLEHEGIPMFLQVTG